MNTQSMGLAVITSASSGIGAVYADRLGLNRQQKHY
jgi:short-subunit dehydrogenase